MATVPSNCPPVKPVQATARWIINHLTEPDRDSLVEISVVNGKGAVLSSCYWVAVLTADGSVVGYRLQKLASDGPDVYDIDASKEAWTCDCRDYQYRRDGQDPNGCKHIAGLRSLLASANK
jgi:hypothetical protein